MPFGIGAPELIIILIILTTVATPVYLLTKSGNSVGMRYCNNCERSVSPLKRFNWAIFLLLSFLYLFYYLRQSETCPICNSTNWGVPPAPNRRAPEPAKPPSPAGRYCSSCGASVLPDAKFCSSCGKSLTPAASSS